MRTAAGRDDYWRRGKALQERRAAQAGGEPGLCCSEITLDYKEPGSRVIKEKTLEAKGNSAAFQVLQHLCFEVHTPTYSTMGRRA